MASFVWLVVAGCLAGVAYLCWRAYRKAEERQRTEEERFAAFMQLSKPAATAEARVETPVETRVEAAPANVAAPPAAASTLPQEKLLFEAAAKAAEAGEPALSIQLYARLIARYPSTSFAAMAKAGVEAQKSKLRAP